MKQIWWSVTFLMCIPFFCSKRKEIKADIKQCMTDGLVLVRVSPQAWRNSIPLTLPSNMLVESRFGGLIISLPTLVFLPVGSPCTPWTSPLGFLVLEKRFIKESCQGMELYGLQPFVLGGRSAEKYVEPSWCLGSGAGWDSKSGDWDEKVHTAGPALTQLFQPKKQLYRINVCKGKEVFSICFLI